MASSPHKKKGGGVIIPSNDPGTIAPYASTKFARISLALAGNPFGPSNTVETLYKQTARDLCQKAGDYPHVAEELRTKLREHHGIRHFQPKEDTMCPDLYVGNGATGVIQDIFNSGLIRSEHYLVVPDATFPVPAGLAANMNVAVRRVSLTADLKIDFDQMKRAADQISRCGRKPSVMFFANPNNPTGYMQPTRSIIELAKACPSTLVIVSEANIDYVPSATLKEAGGTLLDAENIKLLPKNLIVLRSFSKAYGLASSRVGYAVGDTSVLAQVRKRDVPFAMSARSAIEAIIALDDQEHVNKCREHMELETKKIAKHLRSLGFPFVSESDSNLIVAKVPSFFKGSDELSAFLLENECAVVSCGAEFGDLEGKYIRLTPSTSDANNEFCAIIEKVCSEKERDYIASIQVDQSGTPTLTELINGRSKSSAQVGNTPIA